MVKKISKPTSGDGAKKQGGSSKSAGGKSGMSAKDMASEFVANLNNGKLASSVKDSAQQIWLAGMGAFAKAQEEGGKVFDTLVKEGASLQKKTQGMAEDKIAEVTGKMNAMAETVTTKAGQNWDKLESIFEQRTAKAMSKLGVPTAKDVQALSARVDELAAAMGKMSGKATAKVTKVAKSAKAARAGAKPAAKAPAKPRARKTAAA
jgi:poly(hydroxyalkanoate) granule-associated protein